MVALALGGGLRLLELPAWNKTVLHDGGPPLFPSFDAYGWLAAARCVGHLSGQPLALLLQALAATLPFSLETIAFFLPVILSSLAAWPMSALLRGLKAPEASAAAAVCMILTPAYLYRTRLGYCDTDMLLVPLACAAISSMALWRAQPDDAAKDKPASSSMDWSWLLPAAALAGLQWLHPGFRSLTAAMGMLFFLSAWPSVKAGHAALAPCVAIVLSSLLGPWGILAGLLLCGLSPFWPRRLSLSAGRQAWLSLFLLLAALAWAMPAVYDRIRQFAMFYWRFDAADSPAAAGTGPDVARSVLEALSPGWQETIRQSAFHWSMGLAATIAYGIVLVRRPRLLPSLPLAALAILAPVIGIRFAMYGGIITSLGLPLILAWAWKRTGGKAGIGWLLQGLLIAFLAVVAWRDAQTFFPVPIITPYHAAALARLDALAAPDAQIWTWWDYGYAAQFLAKRRSFADPGNNAGAVLRLLSKALAANTPEDAALAMAEGANGQTPPSAPSLVDCFACPEGVRKNGPFPDDSLSRPSPQRLETLPEQYLVTSWEGLRTGRWPMWFAKTTLRDSQGQPPPWPILATSPKRINIDEGWVELEEGVFALSQLDIFQASGSPVRRAWPRSKGLAAVLNLGNAELLLFDSASRHSVMAQLLLDAANVPMGDFELLIDHAPWIRIYRLRSASS